jgi:succinate dehydrogenase / fumarate reductase membrane anchor subunit
MTQNPDNVIKPEPGVLKHWVMQRFSAIMVFTFLIWFVQFMYIISGKDIHAVLYELNLPDHVGCFSIFVVSTLYHGAVGMQVIIEDYVSDDKARKYLVIGMKVFIFITAFLFALSVIAFHKFNMPAYLHD